MDGRYVFRELDPSEAPAMFGLIMGRVAWMDEVGIRQWNVTKYDECYPESYYRAHAEAGRVFCLAEAETGALLAVGLLLEEDERWPDTQGADAYYLHNFATAVGAPKGLGSLFLEALERYAAERGKTWFRLDSADDNETLEAYYTARGYEAAGTCVDGLYTGVLRQKRLSRHGKRSEVSEMEVVRINDNTWRFEEEGVRFFLLAGTEKALMIDSGMMTPNARELAEDVLAEYAAEQGADPLPLELLNTHADPDHLSGNASFAQFYMHPDECYNFYKSGRPGHVPEAFGNGEVVPVWDGDVLDPGGRPLEIIGLPGHTPGSIAVLDVNARVLISGDPIQDGNIYMFGQMREMHAYRMSLQRLERIMAERDPFDEIWPSHGTFPVKPALVAELDAAAGRVLAGEVRASEVEVHGMRIRRADVGCAAFLLD